MLEFFLLQNGHQLLCVLCGHGRLDLKLNLRETPIAEHNDQSHRISAVAFAKARYSDSAELTTSCFLELQTSIFGPKKTQ